MNFKSENKVFYDKIKNFILGENAKKIIVISGLIGIGLIFISNMLTNKDSPKKENQETQISANDYVKTLEDNIKSLISAIDGAGKSKVLITLESSSQNIYATEQKKNSEAVEDRENETISKKRESSDFETKYIKIKDENGAEKPISVTQIQPTIKGVVVVCDGGDNPAVQEKIINAVKTALNITSKRVYVTK